MCQDLLDPCSLYCNAPQTKRGAGTVDDEHPEEVQAFIWGIQHALGLKHQGELKWNLLCAGRHEDHRGLVREAVIEVFIA